MNHTYQVEIKKNTCEQTKFMFFFFYIDSALLSLLTLDCTIILLAKNLPGITYKKTKCNCALNFLTILKQNKKFSIYFFHITNTLSIKSLKRNSSFDVATFPFPTKVLIRWFSFFKTCNSHRFLSFAKFLESLI